MFRDKTISNELLMEFIFSSAGKSYKT